MDTSRFARRRNSGETTNQARQLREQMTPAETQVWSYLRRNGLAGLHFRRQHTIHGFIVDFYCYAASLVVELDSSVHHKSEQYNRERTKILEDHGLKILRFPSVRVESDIHGVLREISTVARQRVE